MFSGEKVHAFESSTCSEDSKGEDTYLLKNHNGDGRCFPCRYHISTRYIPARYVLALLSFTGMINVFTLRMDLNIAILSIANDDHNSTTDSNDTSGMPRYDWSQKQQNMALSSFYYGYCCTQMLGGYLAGSFGGKRIMGLCVLVTSLIALVTPVAIMASYSLLLVCRVIQGLVQGLAMPCMHSMWSNWAPEHEKSKLLTFTYSGAQMGNVVATLATSYICDSSSLKWALVFYVYGGIGVVWSITWLLLVHDTPSQHPRISQEELDYIEAAMAHPLEKTKPNPPWCKILTSPAFLAIVVAHFANDWGYFALTTCLPMYMQHVLKIKIKENGVLSSLAFIILLFVNPLSGFLADMFISRGILSTKNSRKLLNSIGLFIPSFLMIGVCFAGESRDLTIALLTFAVGFTGFTMAGYTVNPLDILPPYAGLVYGMSNTVGTTTGFIGPAILSVLTEDHNTMAEWRVFFIITAAVFFVGGLVFLLLAEGEPQDWVQPYLDEIVTLRYSQIQTDNRVQGNDGGEIYRQTISIKE